MASQDIPELTELNILIDSMNELIISYLDLFDTYQPLQEKLCKQLSSGFFGISQANYASPGHRRYGMDYYDDRMKALKGLEIQHPESSHARFKLKSLLEETSPVEDETTTTAQSVTGLRQRKAVRRRGSDEGAIDETSARLKAVELDDDKASDDEKPRTNEETTREEEKDEERRRLSEAEIRDPIRWFGVLVPPPLRDAQRDFSTALEEVVIISTLLKQMDWYEQEIRVIRVKIKAAKEALARKERESEGARARADTGNGSASKDETT